MSNSIVATIEQYAITDDQLRIKTDRYDLNRIARAEARVLTWKHHVAKMLLSGLIFASLLFLMMPSGLVYAHWLPVIAFTIGALAALSACNRYELRVEYKYLDGTGLQWVTVDSGRSSEDFQRLQSMAREINRQVD
jgi:hypothetical protein